ncbi:MAG: transcriptional repressor, partial [Bacilli bacterium]|nr:transcriptional repressor [Bacilli bacterium]
LESEEDNHVLICTKCHKTVKLEGCPYHEVNEAIESQTGFVLQDHNTEIYGICPDCQNKD